MSTVILHSLAMPPVPVDPTSITLLILGTAIMLVLGAIRWLIQRARVVVMVSGTSVLLVVLTILILAYLVTFRTT
ncbi:hypothetical protein Acor_14260 [Acrocarpospora corrugata]|uniref:Uncharacterized protein n=1 Tax=Acrocarpospora corrugata TaxID=35763 RepID=A0A5M3VW86_9ACTN|nr:hypothetical protein [Acrocarpospora corrugata]GER99362.1 hypothetical protein Acor_14260 [Acrocarpospora corrugata]